MGSIERALARVRDGHLDGALLALDPTETTGASTAGLDRAMARAFGGGTTGSPGGRR